MLRQVLQALEAAKGPVSLDELSRQIGVERSVLEGMIQALVRMGRLRVCASPKGGHGCAQGGCADCSTAQLCALAAPLRQQGTTAKLPATYSLVTHSDADRG